MDFKTMMIYCIGAAGIIAIVTGIMMLTKKMNAVNGMTQYTEESVDKFSKVSGILQIVEGVVFTALVVLFMMKVPFAIAIWEGNGYVWILLILVLPQLILKNTMLKKKN